jgi:hypothetical protein
VFEAAFSISGESKTFLHYQLMILFSLLGQCEVISRKSNTTAIYLHYRLEATHAELQELVEQLLF